MSIEQLATQGRDRLHGGLASVDTALLRHMRDKALRSCFRRLEETSHRMEHVATIHHKEYINDAAARSVNATLYTLQRIAGPVVWIAFGGDAAADYSVLQPVALRKVGKLICVGDDCHTLFPPPRPADPPTAVGAAPPPQGSPGVGREFLKKNF